MERSGGRNSGTNHLEIVKGRLFVVEFLIFVGVIIFVSILLSKVSDRMGIPILLLFILLGMLVGSDGVFKLAFDNYDLANKLCTIALIFIMFYGGFGTNWRAAKPVAVKAGVLASFGVLVTSLLTGLFCHFLLGMSWLEGLLLGSVLGSTDAASVFTILRTRKLALKDNTDSLLEMESGSNDPFSYMMTIVFLSLMKGSISPGSALLMLILQVVIGAGIGAIIAGGMVYLLRRRLFSSGGANEVLLVAVAILGYALPEFLGGNGYLSAYIIGIVIGNQKFDQKQSLVHFFDGLTMLMQIIIFFLLGLLSNPSRIIPIFLSALGIMAFMTFIARPAAVFSLLSLFRRRKSSLGQKLVVSWAGIRGAASIVFAIIAVSSGVPLAHDLFHIVFAIVLVSLLLQGGLLPFVSYRTNMYQEDGDVMKTFNDYEDEKAVQFVTTNIHSGHKWIDKQIMDVFIPQDIRIVMVERENQQFVPSGDTVLEEGDRLILMAMHYDETSNVRLKERILYENDSYIGKALRDITLRPGRRIILIRRDGEIIIPTGDTEFKVDDTIVFNSIRNHSKTKVKV
ncbi:MAG TPA: potassium/proton antiporter [Clostridiaceae bacterium]|nr:potassium/proton antiporter [Clostridiaceae bacterium]